MNESINLYGMGDTGIAILEVVVNDKKRIIAALQAQLTDTLETLTRVKKDWIYLGPGGVQTLSSLLSKSDEVLAKLQEQITRLESGPGGITELSHALMRADDQIEAQIALRHAVRNDLLKTLIYVEHKADQALQGRSGALEAMLWVVRDKLVDYSQK